MGSNNLGRREEGEGFGAGSSVSVHACFMESNHFVCRTAVNIPHKDSLSRPLLLLHRRYHRPRAEDEENQHGRDRQTSEKDLHSSSPFRIMEGGGVVYKESRRETNAEFCRKEEGDCCTQKERFPRRRQMIAVYRLCSSQKSCMQCPFALPLSDRWCSFQHCAELPFPSLRPCALSLSFLPRSLRIVSETTGWTTDRRNFDIWVISTIS